jgi:hypothetical protein
MFAITGIQLAEFLQGLFFHMPCAIGSAVKLTIMDYYRMSICREMDIQFDSICPLLKGELKGFEGVLWRIMAGAAVGKDGWHG